MDQVDWGGALSIKKVTREKPNIRHVPWVDLCKPTASVQIRGNRQCVDAISDWFNRLQCSGTGNPGNPTSLFIHGPSGVWKSTAVVLCASEHGFSVVHTHSDVPRTPQKLDAVLREVGLCGGRGVLLLDEFESFIKETTSLKWLLRFLKSSQTSPVVVVSNAVDKCFHPIRDVSTVVEFQPYSNGEMYATLLRLSSKVSGFCHLPPMDCYFISSMCSGNVCQTVNQLQILYYGSKLKTKNKKQQKLAKVQSKCMQDSTMKMWSNTHRATSVDCFINDPVLLEAVAGMNREFMMGLSDNLFKEYLLYFHNGSSSTLDVTASCAENISAANCGLASKEQQEDRMYESQNSALWSEDNVNFIACTCTALRFLRGRKKNSVVLRRKSAKKVFKFC